MNGFQIFLLYYLLGLFIAKSMISMPAIQNMLEKFDMPKSVLFVGVLINALVAPIIGLYFVYFYVKIWLRK